MPYTITADQIDQTASEKSEIRPWGYKEYRKRDGQWVLDHLLIVDKDAQTSTRVYTDDRPDEIIHWGEPKPQWTLVRSGKPDLTSDPDTIVDAVLHSWD